MKNTTVVPRFVAYGAAGFAYAAAGALAALATTELPLAPAALAVARFQADHALFLAQLFVVAGLVVLSLGHVPSIARGARLAGGVFALFVVALSVVSFVVPPFARLGAPIPGF